MKNTVCVRHINCAAAACCLRRFASNCGEIGNEEYRTTDSDRIWTQAPESNFELPNSSPRLGCSIIFIEHFCSLM